MCAKSTETGESCYKRVIRTFARKTVEIVKVSYGGKTITTTPTHPFYVPQKGWTEAIDLRAGDILVTCNGEYVVVEQVQHEILESPITVYNFEVEDFHTYYVGDTSVLVHNRCRAKNKLEPNSDAGGAHTSFKYGADGKIQHYASYESNPLNPTGFDEVLRYDGVGKAHNGIATPHLHIRGKVRPAYW